MAIQSGEMNAGGKFIRRVFIPCLLCILLGNLYAAPDPEVVLSDASQLLLVGEQSLILKDSSGNLELQDILKPAYQQKFHRQQTPVFSQPATPGAYWFKITIKNFSDENAWLEVGSTYAWYIDFYAPNDSGKYTCEALTGTMRPDSNKFHDINLFWLPVNEAGDSSAKTYYLRIQSGLTYELPLYAGTLRSLSKNKDIHDFLTAGFLGVIIIMLLYNLFIYLSTREHIYLYYLGYLFIMLFSMPYANNYPFVEHINFWFIDKAWWNKYFLFWHPSVYFFIGIFCIKYLNLKEHGKRIRILILFEIVIISGVYPLLTLLGLPLSKLVNSFQVCILIFYLTCLTTGYYFAIRRQSKATYYVLGWTFMVVGVFVFFAVINGLLPYHSISRNALYIGTTIEVWMFSLALGNRLNLLQKEKNQIRHENLLLIREQNQMLEKKVHERTLALEGKNEELQTSNQTLRKTTDQLNKQSQQLKELNMTKDKLFAIVSHDLRAPIITLSNLISLADDQALSATRYKKLSSKLKSDVKHLHFTLNNLLQWALTQMEGLKTNQEELLLYPLVEENIQLLNEYARNKEINLNNSIDSKVKVFADPDQLRLILRNLISNAIKFTKPGGRVEISAEELKAACEVAITDSGVGIPSEILENLFTNKSVQSSFGTSGERGTGLGLMLCQDFIEKHGGKIWAISKDGEGTTFRFTLPTFMPDQKKRG